MSMDIIARGMAGNALQKVLDLGDLVEKVGKVLVYQGTLPTYGDLPKNPSVGDVYGIQDTGEEFVWTDQKKWESLGPLYDFSTLQARVDVKGVLEGKGNGQIGIRAIDSTPKKSSTNLISSGAVAQALSDLETTLTLKVSNMIALDLSAHNTNKTAHTDIRTEVKSKLNAPKDPKNNEYVKFVDNTYITSPINAGEIIDWNPIPDPPKADPQVNSTQEYTWEDLK